LAIGGWRRNVAGEDLKSSGAKSVRDGTAYALMAGRHDGYRCPHPGSASDLELIQFIELDLQGVLSNGAPDQHRHGFGG
jgi:hypothetical protein